MVAALTVAIALATSSATAQEPLLWGSLEPGPHAVGFRTLFQSDDTRQYDPEYATDPTQPPAHRPRPILIAVWYPAAKTSAKPIEYGRYLDVSSSDARFAPFASRLAHETRNVVCEETVHQELGALAPAETAAFDRLLATPTFAVKDAPAAEGRFPVVLYHPGLGGSYEDNSVLFEYLASHGYVVVSSAFQDTDASSVSLGGDMNCSFRDLEFLGRAVRGLAFADADRLAAMGHSYGAYTVLAWAALPDSSVRAVVSLDSGLEYDTLETAGVPVLETHMKANQNNLRAATLRFASKERAPHFEYLDPYLKFVPRYEATAASLTHNDYLTHGAIGPALMPDKWPDPGHARRTSYDRVCAHVLDFFDATLMQRAEAQAHLQRSGRGEGLDAGFKLACKPATPLPPTNRQLSLYIRQHGAEKAAELMRAFPERARGRAIGAGMSLLQDGDADVALAHLTLAAKTYPESVALQALLGQACVLTDDREGAAEAFHKAEELLPVDESAGALRPYWKRMIEKGLEALNRLDK